MFFCWGQVWVGLSTWSVTMDLQNTGKVIQDHIWSPAKCTKKLQWLYFAYFLSRKIINDIYITSSPVSTTICSMMKGHISVTCNAPNLLPTHQLKWYSNCKVELKQWNLLRCNTPSCWSANTQSLLHTWNTLWWLQIQRTFTSCVQFLALPLCLFGHESCVDLSFALDHLTVCSVTNYAPCVVNFQRWLFVSVDRAIIKCVFLIAFRCCNILSQIKLVHTSWCLAVEIIGVWHESYPSSATVSSLSHVMRLHSYWMS